MCAFLRYHSGNVRLFSRYEPTATLSVGTCPTQGAETSIYLFKLLFDQDHSHNLLLTFLQINWNKRAVTLKTHKLKLNLKIPQGASGRKLEGLLLNNSEV